MAFPIPNILSSEHGKPGYQRVRRRSFSGLNGDSRVDDFCDGDNVDIKPLLGTYVASPVSMSGRTRHVPSGDASSSGLNGQGYPIEESPLSRSDDCIGVSKEQTDKLLQEQLRLMQEELRLKDSECAKMYAYRDRVSAELEDLTASLFEEANKIIREEKVKRYLAEKLLAETNMKLEGLQSETVWRREQMSNGQGRPSRSASMHILNSPSSNQLAELAPTAGVVKWFRSLGQPPLPEIIDVPPAESQETEVPRKETDPIVHREFVSWREKPALNRELPLIRRIYEQDIEPNFEFTNADLAAKALKAVEDNTLVIEESSKYKPFARTCSLSLAPRLCCYRMKINEDNTWYPISAFARNRITSVCDFLTYVRYIQQGLVRRGVHDTWWEIVSHREKMSKARLGIL